MNKIDNVEYEDAILNTREKNIFNEPIQTDLPHNYDGLDTKSLKIAGFIMLAVFVILGPKIFLANNIYHISKDLLFLSNQEDILKEENKKLKQELERLNYQYF